MPIKIDNSINLPSLDKIGSDFVSTIYLQFTFAARINQQPFIFPREINAYKLIYCVYSAANILRVHFASLQAYSG